MLMRLVKKGLLFLLGILLFLSTLSCFMVLYRNVFLYVADYYPADFMAIHQHIKLFISLCMFNLLLGKYVVGRLSYTQWLTIGSLSATLGLLLSTLALPLPVLLGGSLVMLGLLLSLPALVDVLARLADTHHSYPKIIGLCVVLLALLLIDWDLLAHSQSFYAFREWCLAFAVLLALVTLISRLVCRQRQITSMAPKHLRL